MSKTWSAIADVLAKMKETETVYVAAGLDVLKSYGPEVAKIAKQNLKRKSSNAELDGNDDGSAYNNEDHTVVTTNDDNTTSVTAHSVKDTIFAMVLKKFRGIAWTELEKRTLQELDDNSPFLNVNLTLPGAVVSLLKENHRLTDTNISVLKLSLSGIVNQLNAAQFDASKTYLPSTFDQTYVDDVVNKIKEHQMKSDTVDMFHSILHALESEENPVELALLEIDSFEAKFLKGGGRRTEEYIMLKVVEYFLETLDDWEQDDSETTIYRRIATIFDFMFRDTQVKLADGETICDSTHEKERQYNDHVYGSSSTDRQLFGRKIELLIRFGNNVKSLELSSNEFKNPSAATSQVLAHQNKNLRVNDAILNHLHSLNGKTGTVLAMDWIGNS